MLENPLIEKNASVPYGSGRGHLAEQGGETSKVTPTSKKEMPTRSARSAALFLLAYCGDVWAGWKF